MIDEEKLWIAVIAQALRDANASNNYDYFDMGNREFIMVCSLANRNPREFIKKIEKMLKASRDFKKLRKRIDCKVAATDYAELLEFNSSQIINEEN